MVDWRAIKKIDAHVHILPDAVHEANPDSEDVWLRSDLCSYRKMIDGLSIEKAIIMPFNDPWLMSMEFTIDAVHKNLYPNGESWVLTLPSEYFCGGNDNYLFYTSYDDPHQTEWGAVCCTDITTGETWKLDIDTYTDDLYNLRADGNYLYSTAPWEDGHMCWELIYDANGKPISIRLIEEDITE